MAKSKGNLPEGRPSKKICLASLDEGGEGIWFDHCFHRHYFGDYRMVISINKSFKK